MGNISQFAQATNTLSVANGLILVSPDNIGYQPQSGAVKNGSPPQQQPGFLFNYEGENTATITSDITDHYIENNSAIQDQISLKPIIITVHGFIGELNDVVPKSLQPLKAVADKLTILGAYTPELTTAALIAYNNAFQLYQAVSNTVQSAINAIKGGNQTKQQQVWTSFYSYWQNRTLFTIQTPWAIHNNMAIQTLRAIQDAETRMITDFEITFKQLQFASTVVIQNNFQDSSLFQNRSSNQNSASTPVNLGTGTQGPDVTQVVTA